MTNNYAPYIWKITDFQAVYDKAVTGEQETILSEPFYLFKNGYKLRIKMFANGGSAIPDLSKKFRGNLSVFVKLIPGEYDSVLAWPFTEKLRITLIDQDPRWSNRANIEKVVDFKVREWPRPLKESDLGMGFADFVHHSVLQSRSYLKNNTIFIMVSRCNAQ